MHEWIGLIETYDDWSTTNHVIRSYNEFGYILSSMVYDNNGDFLDGFEYQREDDWRIVLEKSYTSEMNLKKLLIIGMTMLKLGMTVILNMKKNTTIIGNMKRSQPLIKKQGRYL